MTSADSTSNDSATAEPPAPRPLGPAMLAAAALLIPGVLLGLGVAQGMRHAAQPQVEFVKPPAGGGSSAAAGVIDAPNFDEIGGDPAVLSRALAGVSTAIKDRAFALEDPSLTSFAGAGLPPAKAVPAGEIPRDQRWQVFFEEGTTEAGYAQQLDFFGIELGVLGAAGQIEYAFQLSKNKPSHRTGQASQEQRLYMSWGRGNYAEADRTLLALAGVESAGKIVLQFYPEITENKLASLEEKFANRQPAEIYRTRFGIKTSDEGFSLYVLDQTPLK